MGHYIQIGRKLPVQIINKKVFMTKEIVKHQKNEKKKPSLTPKEKKAKKAEKKQNKANKVH